MESELRVEDDDDSRYVFEGFGPLNRGTSAERLGIQRFMQRVARDVMQHGDDYGTARDALILLAENYARTCATSAELERRLAVDAESRLPDTPGDTGTAARLLAQIWQAEQAGEPSRE